MGLQTVLDRTVLEGTGRLESVGAETETRGQQFEPELGHEQYQEWFQDAEKWVA